VSDASRLVAGRYRLGTRLGSGAMGVVWQAHDERLHRTVAVKQLLLQPGLPADHAEQARQRALREGRIAARLQHAGAVTVHDVVTDDGDPWLIMEYLPSKSLAGVLAEHGSLPPHEVARVGAQAAAALTAAHTAGIVHRDVKPGNVLLGEDGVVKITDFGISRAIGDITVTATGILAGTPAYLAPELAQGAEPTPASDVYSLGATLYKAVEGEPPCGNSDNQLALLHAVAAGRLNAPRQAGPLTAVLMSLLRTNPADRPSMANSKEALNAVAAGRVVPGALLNEPATTAEATGPTEPARPIAVAPPPLEHTRTRLDTPSRPGSLPPSPAPAMTPPRGTMRAAIPDAPSLSDRDWSGARRVLVTVLAIAVAIIVGISVASLFLP
jgi:serine/threonine protein kinase